MRDPGQFKAARRGRVLAALVIKRNAGPHVAAEVIGRAAAGNLSKEDLALL